MIKKYWWVLGIGIILFVVLMWPRKQKTDIGEKQTQEVGVRTDLNLPLDLPKIKGASWTTTKDIELPKVTNKLIRRQNIDDSREIKIKGILGINETNGFVDKINNIVEYAEEIKGINQLPMAGNWEIETLKNKLKTIVEKVNTISNLDIKWVDVKYQEILYPRWIESTEKNARSVEITGDYMINGIRTTTYYGPSIKGVFNKEGRLLKLGLTLKPQVLSEEGSRELINIEEASKSPVGLYAVVNNAGVENIGSVNITQAEIVEVFSNKNNIINPYYWLNGNTYNEDQPFRISLLLKAEK